MRYKKRAKKEIQRETLFSSLLAILLFWIGACLFLYPTISNYLAERQQVSVIREYEKEIDSDDAVFLDEE